MVEQHYRWDFIGLSTDTKPTPESNTKVTDGSTYYCSDTSKLYVWCKDNWYERKPLGGGGGSDINVVQTTGTSTTDVMSQNAVTEALASAGGVKELTVDDYNYPTNNPDRVALWLLESGMYKMPRTGVNIYYSNSDMYLPAAWGEFVIIEQNHAGLSPITMYFFGNDKGMYFAATLTSGARQINLTYTLLSNSVVQTTGTSTSQLMSQKAVTDALASAGGGVKTLTSADYNYHRTGDTDDGIAFWLLDEGQYILPSNTNFYKSSTFINAEAVNYPIGIIVYNKSSSNTKGCYVTYNPAQQNDSHIYYNVNANGSEYQDYLVTTKVINNLTSTDNKSALSAAQGRTLKNSIGDLTSLTTTDKTSLVNAINELAGRISTLEGN